MKILFTGTADDPQLHVLHSEVQKRRKKMAGLLMKYFVLKPKGEDIYAKASRTAMHAYARVIKDSNTELFLELTDWAATEGAEAMHSEDAKER